MIQFYNLIRFYNIIYIPYFSIILSHLKEKNDIFQYCFIEMTFELFYLSIIQTINCNYLPIPLYNDYLIA